MIEIKKYNNSGTQEEINSLIELLKTKTKKEIFLPKDYITFLIKYNGSNFEEENIKYKPSNLDIPEIEISELSSTKDLIDSVNLLDKIEFKGDYLYSLINDLILTKIGFEKWGGYEISIGIGEKNNGFIYISQLYSAIDFMKIADSFTEFIEKLELLEEN